MSASNAYVLAIDSEAWWMSMLLLVQHFDEATLLEAQEDLDGEMPKMGFTKLGTMRVPPNICQAYYDIYDMSVGLRPDYLSGKINQLNQKPDQFHFEFKLIAEKKMPTDQ
jgi:hypothetical protein